MWQLIAAAAGLSMIVGGYGAHKVTSWRCEAARAEAIEEWQEQFDEVNARYRTEERRILKQARERREAISELAMDLSGDISDCRISDNGLRDISTAVQAMFPGAE